MSFLDEVHALLAGAEIAHAVVGATALALYGHPRATEDIDLMTTSWAVFERDLWALLEERGAEVEIRRGDDDDPLAGVVVLRRGLEVIDVVVGRERWRRELIERADSSGGIPVVRLTDLVLLKLDAGGLKDRRDVEVILPLLSAEQLAKIEGRLGLLSEWSRGHWEQIRRATSG